jgi:menaquinone-dependent protoporphyrinogen oxidase
MAHKILVAYASRTGTTAEVARSIGKTLSEGGAQVDVLAMQAVKDLSPYQSVVAGSAIRQFKWLPEAAEFIAIHRQDLSQKRFAMFSVGIAIAKSDTEQSRAAVSAWTAPVRAQVNPLSEGLFAGWLNFSKLPPTIETGVLRLMVLLGVFPKGDHRNWDAVRAWAAELGPILAG